MERTVVQSYLYPAFLSPSPSPSLSFSDQCAFWPTSSSAAAIIYLLHTITDMLLSSPYVIVISLDFTKAFDMVRHSTMLEKMAKLDMPEYVYNWLVEFFSEHSHCTVYNGQTSTVKKITASIIQGSGFLNSESDVTLIVAMGGATDFKVGGTKQTKNFFLYPHFSKCGGYKQANINRDLLNILKFAVWLSH